MMIESFYDDLAPYHKYLFWDWDTSVDSHGAVLDGVIREHFGKGVHTILDASCGIGTQSIGLAKLGYQVTGSDISQRAIEAARSEVERHGVSVKLEIADMRKAWDHHQDEFDVVIACVNSVPHLLNDEDILVAFQQMYQCTKPGGGCIISVRDYARMEREAGEKKIYPRSVRTINDRRLVLLDVWDFYDQNHYEITMYLIEDDGAPVVNTKAIRGGKYYCVEIPTLTDLFLKAGFNKVEVLKDRYFQPLLAAFKSKRREKR